MSKFQSFKGLQVHLFHLGSLLPLLMTDFTSFDKTKFHCLVDLVGPFCLRSFPLLRDQRLSAIAVDALDQEPNPPSRCSQKNLSLSVLAKVMFVTEQSMIHLLSFWLRREKKMTVKIKGNVGGRTPFLRKT